MKKVTLNVLDRHLLLGLTRSFAGSREFLHEVDDFRDKLTFTQKEMVEFGFNAEGTAWKNGKPVALEITEKLHEKIRGELVVMEGQGKLQYDYVYLYDEFTKPNK